MYPAGCALAPRARADVADSARTTEAIGDSLALMTPLFRLVSSPAALEGAPAGWATDLLLEGEIAFLADGGGIDAVSEAAHTLGYLTVPLVRTEPTETAQEGTIIDFAASLPLIWVAPSFTDHARTWAHDRGPMTLLIESAGGLTEEDRGRLARFVSILGRQTD